MNIVKRDGQYFTLTASGDALPITPDTAMQVVMMTYSVGGEKVTPGNVVAFGRGLLEMFGSENDG